MITVLPSERRRSFQSTIKSESLKRKEFSTRDTRHAGQKKFLQCHVHYTEPVTYKLKDFNGAEIKGSFYEQELQKTTQDMFRIEKVIRRKGDKSLVKWVGYPDEFNSRIDSKDLVKL